MKMKKFLACLLATVLAAGACTSCKKQAEETDGNVTLTVGNWPATEGETLNHKNKLKEGFEAKYPDIKINPDTWSFDLSTFYPKAEAGLLPDIFNAHFTEFQKLTDGDYVEDLTDIMKETGYYENLNPILKDMCTKDGKIYALPYEAYILCLNVNVDLLGKAGLLEADGTPKQPKTWEELGEFAKIIKEKTGVPGFALCTSNNCGGWFFTNIAWSYGVDFMEEQSDGSWKATFDTDEAAAALQFVKDLKWKYDCVPSNNIIDQTESLKLFATEGAAMVLDGPLTGQIAKYEFDPAKYGALAIPAGPAKQVALLGGGIYCVPKGTSKDKIDAAFKWLKFTGISYSVDDDIKSSMEADYLDYSNKKYMIGIKALSPWSGESEQIKLRNQLIDQYISVKPNSVRLYNECVEKGNIEFQAEEPVCCQDLYGVLDNIIQEVYQNKDADCRALVKKANDDFQRNYLDNLDY